jgi:hypothetical protein
MLHMTNGFSIAGIAEPGLGVGKGLAYTPLHWFAYTRIHRGPLLSGIPRGDWFSSFTWFGIGNGVDI